MDLSYHEEGRHGEEDVEPYLLPQTISVFMGIPSDD
jgi:hypothetical protein